MSFLAESVAEMSDDQIKEEYAHEPKPRTKEIFKATLKDLKKEKLRAARALYESSVTTLSSRVYNLPQDSSEKRILLASVLAQKPDLRPIAFTAQHRELKDLTDADIESFLKQLAELGLLDAFLRGK
jgi:hypothetical protein